MNLIYSMNKRSDNTLAIYNATTSQTTKIVSVDGSIIGTPNVSGSTGTVNVKKGTTTKVYVYDLRNGSVQKIYNV